MIVESISESVHTLKTMDTNNRQSKSTSEVSAAQIYAALVRLLAAREQSQAELRRKLLEKDYSAEMINKQLQQAVEDNIQSDERFAEMSLRVAVTKRHGPNKLKQKLQQHDIDSELINNVVCSEVIDWFQHAYEVKTKKFGETVETDWHQRQKQQRFLFNRGFTFEQINHAVSYNPALDA